MNKIYLRTILTKLIAMRFAITFTPMTLSFKIKQSLPIVFTYLSDYEKFVSVHPIIFKITKNTDGSYKVFEKLKLGPIPITFTYQTSIVSDIENKNITMIACIMRFTKIEIQFNLTQENGYTVIEEVTLFKSPLPIKSILERIFKKQHGLLFRNIENINK